MHSQPNVSLVLYNSDISKLQTCPLLWLVSCALKRRSFSNMPRSARSTKFSCQPLAKAVTGLGGIIEPLPAEHTHHAITKAANLWRVLARFTVDFLLLYGWPRHTNLRTAVFLRWREIFENFQEHTNVSPYRVVLLLWTPYWHLNSAGFT